MALARTFELHLPGGAAISVLHGGALHATLFADVVGCGGTGVVFHLRRRGGGGVRQGHGGFVAAIAHDMGCDDVKMVRLGPYFDSPIIHIKNFGSDRGGWLLGKMTIQHGPHALHPQQHPGFGAITGGTALLYECADRCFELAEAAVRDSSHPYKNESLRALRHRSQYMPPAALYYTPQAKLGHHKDGMGSWLVLFSFGLTVDFFVGGESVVFESGDALIFVGNSVEHGIDNTLAHATRGGKGWQRCDLPRDVARMTHGLRVSLQARQQ